MQNGKKSKQWTKDRAKLIKDAALIGRISIANGFVEGICEDCKWWKPLDPDHRRRRSQGGSNDKSNIDWVCRDCHRKRDQEGDPMQKKEKSSKKPNWQLPHPCKSCKLTVSTLICHFCGKMSV